MIYYKLFRKDSGYPSKKQEYYQLRLNTKHKNIQIFSVSLYKCVNPEKEGYTYVKDQDGIYYYKYL